MAHGIRCAISKSDKKTCKCSCGGKHHGTQAGIGDFCSDSIDRVMTEKFGGEIEKYIKKIKGRKFFCMCGNKLVADIFFGYPHVGGLADKDGETWWLYVKCDNCEYSSSFWRIKNKIKTLVE